MTLYMKHTEYAKCMSAEAGQEHWAIFKKTNAWVRVYTVSDAESHECSRLGEELNFAQALSWEEEPIECLTKMTVWVYFEDVNKGYTY